MKSEEDRMSKQEYCRQERKRIEKEVRKRKAETGTDRLKALGYIS